MVTRRRIDARRGRAVPWRGAGALFALALLSSAAAAADRIGCPMFHCTPEGTSVMVQPILATVGAPPRQNGALGTLGPNPCSGNGEIIACLFLTDAAHDPYVGALKVLDAANLDPHWGSNASTIVNPYRLNFNTIAAGQAPYILRSGLVSAGDAANQALYDPLSGELAAPLVALDGRGRNFGITPLVSGLGAVPDDEDYGIVSQSNGVFTLIRLFDWTQVGPRLELRDPQSDEAIKLQAPAGATGTTLYAVANNASKTRNYLFSVRMDTTAMQLVAGPSILISGVAGAAPVVVKPSVSGLESNLVLVETADRLAAIVDQGTTLETLWAMPLQMQAALEVAPTIDETTRTLFLQDARNAKLLVVDLLTGTARPPVSIRALGGFPSGFTLNGHVGSVQSEGVFTLLLSGSWRGGGEYMIAYRPFVDPGALLWKQKIYDGQDAYTGAWGLAPSNTAGVYCPVVVGKSSGITIAGCDH